MVGCALAVECVLCCFELFFFPYRFNSAVGIEMIDNVNKTEHRFDSIASVGKFGMKKAIH